MINKILNAIFKPNPPKQSGLTNNRPPQVYAQIDTSPKAFTNFELYDNYHNLTIIKKVIDFVVNRTVNQVEPKIYLHYTKNLVQTLLLYGYVLIIKKSLFILDNRFVETYVVDTETAPRLIYVKYRNGQKDEYYTTEELHILAINNLVSTLGTSPLQACFYQIEQYKTFQEVKLARLKNGGSPSLLLAVPDQGSPDKNDEFFNNYKTSFQGNAKQGRPFIMVKQPGLAGNQLEVYEPKTTYFSNQDNLLKQMCLDSIAEAYGIPTSYIVGFQTQINEYEANVIDIQLDDTTSSLAILVEEFLSEVFGQQISIISLLSNYKLRQVALDIQLRNAQAQLQFSQKQQSEIKPLIEKIT